MIDFYKVPVFELNRIKNGEDYVLPDGTVIPNNRLTTPPAPPRSYAYCSDTIFHRPIIEQIKGVNLLFTKQPLHNVMPNAPKRHFTLLPCKPVK